ncbi:MAG: ATP-dependent DNA helicase [Sporichthyaceae bacterium]
MPGVPRLSAEQAHAAASIASSGRRLDVLVGAAGTGKTRALFALRAAWEQTHGAGSVIGLAPSATAAAELSAALRIGADTVAKWIHESHPDTASGPTWHLRAGQLVIVDEAAMVATTHLDALAAQATAAGAKLILVGDHHQLGAIDAGGAFALLATEGHAVELDQTHRFTEAWEAGATRALRVGEPAALDAYAAHGRLHDGPNEVMVEAAYRAWATDTRAGLRSLLLAHDRDTVSALNRRARADRIRAGQVEPTSEVRLQDGSEAGRGDVITTRRNNRRLVHPDGGYVRNGDRWQITATHPDGSLDAVPAARADDTAGSAAAIRLPAEYVRDHVELGYAVTIHRAQGQTVDTAHLIAAPGLTREALYVGMTRGRHANHAYSATESTEHHDTGPDGPILTGRQILNQIMATSGSQPSAIATLRVRHDRAGALSGLIASNTALASEVERLIRTRRAALHGSPRPHNRRFHPAPPPPQREGPGR